MTDRATCQSFERSVAKIVDNLRRGNNVSPHVLIGPLVWEGETNDRQWYFVLGSGDRRGFRADKVAFKSDKELAKQTLFALHLALVHHKPIVIHTFDDELEMARWAHSIWPSEKTRKIRDGSVAERTASAS